MHAVTEADPLAGLAFTLAAALNDMAARIGPRAAGVALSGGADSLALALAARRLDPQIPLAIVDHGLRPESGAEACRVAQGFWPPPEILLAGTEARIRGGVEERARNARYGALAAWARMRGLGLVLTGHHADDAVETLAMRLQRRPGLLGLAGLRPLAPFPNWPEGAGLFLGRPFLGLRRAQLRAVLRGAGRDWVEDPMNADSLFERARLRALWADADAEADARRFQRMFGLYERLRARRARAAATACKALARVSFDEGSEKLALPGEIYSELPVSAQALLAQALVAAIADRPLLPAAGAARRHFLAAITGAKVTSFHLTLVSARSGQLQVARAPARRRAPPAIHGPRPSPGPRPSAAARARDLLVS